MVRMGNGRMIIQIIEKIICYKCGKPTHHKINYRGIDYLDRKYIDRVCLECNTRYGLKEEIKT